jgi:hypothetical protein
VFQKEAKNNKKKFMEELSGWLKYSIKMIPEVIKHTKPGMGDAS